LPKILTYEPDRIIGQFIHEQLYFFAEAKLAVNKFKVNPHYCQQRLIELGLEQTDLNDAIETFESCITNMQNCETAQWILDPAHTDANNEYSIETQERRYIIDRTFVENNTRWIIDYKISTDMSSNAETYQQQLEQYGQLFQSMSDTPVKLMLYYPLLQQAKTWS
jgi:ATP-dependent exoDNAse (exonuclease V) beta subunit